MAKWQKKITSYKEKNRKKNIYNLIYKRELKKKCHFAIVWDIMENSI